MAKRSLRERVVLGPADVVPEKLYFKIGEVARLVGVEAHVIRYWEKELPLIRPQKSPSNQRRYRRKDVLLLREAKRLLHDEKYTLAGARRRLTRRDGDESAAQNKDSVAPDRPQGAQTRRSASVVAVAIDPQKAKQRRQTLSRVRTQLAEILRVCGA